MSSLLILPSHCSHHIAGQDSLAATLLDFGTSCAVQITLPAGVGYITLDISVNFVRPLTSETGMVTCVGTVIHVGGRMDTTEARLTDAAGKLYAHGTTTCLILRP